MSIKQRVTRPPSSEGGITIPDSVRHADYLAAMRPLLDLVGADPFAILCDLHIDGDSITLRSILPIEGVEAVPSDDSEGALWCWPVSVRIDRGDV